MSLEHPIHVNSLAYIDPGSGSYMIQLLVGGVVGGLYLVKIYWRRIRASFGRRGKADDGGDSD